MLAGRFFTPPFFGLFDWDGWAGSEFLLADSPFALVLEGAGLGLAALLFLGFNCFGAAFGLTSSPVEPVLGAGAVSGFFFMGKRFGAEGGAGAGAGLSCLQVTAPKK